MGPFRFVVLAVAGWVNQRQLQTIDYVREENRVLREQLGDRRLRFNDDQRRRLAAKANGLGRKILADIVTIVAPEILLVWHCKLIAQKYDGSGKRAPGRPRTRQDLEALVVRIAEENRRCGYRRIQGAFIESGARDNSEHDYCDFETTRDRACTGAQPEDHLEGVSGPALGIDCGC